MLALHEDCVKILLITADLKRAVGCFAQW